jgi:hypothetical protein
MFECISSLSVCSRKPKGAPYNISQTTELVSGPKGTIKIVTFLYLKNIDEPIGAVGTHDSVEV